MLKRTLLCGALGLFMMPVWAQEITLTLGGLSSSINSDITYSENTSAYDVIQSGNGHTLTGELALGYVWNINTGFGLGFEFFYDIGGPTAQVASLDGGTVEDKVNNSYGLRFLPQFKITNNTDIYIELGYAVVDHTMSLNSANSALFTDTNNSSSSSGVDFSGGFRYGAGIETLVYDNLGVRLAFSVTDAGDDTIETADKSQSYSAAPTIYNFMFGASYHFQF